MKKFLRKIYFFPPFFPTATVFADDSSPPPELTDGTLQRLVDNILSYLFPIAGLICVIFIIQGGYMWIISAGNPENVKKAQGTLTWAIIGLVLLMIIFGILTVVLDFLYQ